MHSHSKVNSMITIPSSAAKNHKTTRVDECDLLICSVEKMHNIMLYYPVFGQGHNLM